MALLAIGSAPFLLAHEGIAIQIREIDDEIKESGSSTKLLQSRAHLYLEHREWDRSLADYQKVIEAVPTLNSAHLGMARCYLGKEETTLGLEAVNRFLKSSGDDFQGRLCRARLLVQQGRLEEASADYRQALVKRPRNNLGMEIYFEWAEKLKGGGMKWYPEALRVLDAGAKEVGENIALQELAIGIEVDSGNLPGALSRIDRVLSGPLCDSPRWLLRRAEMLEALKRTAEAVEAYRKTLVTIRKIPTRRRNVTAVRAIETKAIAQINHLKS